MCIQPYVLRTTGSQSRTAVLFEYYSCRILQLQQQGASITGSQTRTTAIEHYSYSRKVRSLPVARSSQQLEQYRQYSRVPAIHSSASSQIQYGVATHQLVIRYSIKYGTMFWSSQPNRFQRGARNPTAITQLQLLSAPLAQTSATAAPSSRYNVLVIIDFRA